MNINLKPSISSEPISMELESLMSKASEKRDLKWGNVTTYSRKVFVPLTNMCRDTCGYCTFVKHPDSPEANIMTPEEVLDIVKKGEQKGCKEVLFSLGEKPELRYEKAKRMLNSLGYARMTDYLRDMCELVLTETNLLPHVNSGTLTNEEIDSLSPVTASMGMMLETLSRRLNRKGGAHYACPDKVPLQRLRTLKRAGERNVPFTTGILIGIGETKEERLEALQEINCIHQKYGHIQEVIIQNFQSKPDIEMALHPEPSLDDMLWTIANARLILDIDISVQAPPNLSERHIDYIKAGINDWGGISPITIDFINPQHDWPEIRELMKTTSNAGHILKERLTVYPSFFKNTSKYLHENIRNRVSTMADENGLPKDQYCEVDC